MTPKVTERVRLLLAGERGETLAETLSGILIATFSIVVLLSAVTSATNVNVRAQERNAEISAQQEYAASYGNSGGVSGVTESAAGGATVTFTSTAYGSEGKAQTFKANYYGGDDFVAYAQKQASVTGGGGSTSYTGTRTTAPYGDTTATQEELDLVVPGVAPQDKTWANIWIEESNGGKTYLALRNAWAMQTDKTVTLVYYNGRYYKHVNVYNPGTSYESENNTKAYFWKNELDVSLLESGRLYGGNERWVEAK